MKTISLLCAIALTSFCFSPAFAASEYHARCTGTAVLDLGAGNKHVIDGVTLCFDDTADNSAPGGRQYLFRMDSQAASYQCFASDPLNFPRLTVTLTGVENPSHKLFQGTVEYVNDGGMLLSGTWSADGLSEPVPMEATLACVSKSIAESNCKPMLPR